MVAQPLTRSRQGHCVTHDKVGSLARFIPKWPARLHSYQPLRPLCAPSALAAALSTAIYLDALTYDHGGHLVFYVSDACQSADSVLILQVSRPPRREAASTPFSSRIFLASPASYARGSTSDSRVRRSHEVPPPAHDLAPPGPESAPPEAPSEQSVPPQPERDAPRPGSCDPAQATALVGGAHIPQAHGPLVSWNLRQAPPAAKTE